MALTNNNREDWRDVFEQAVALRDIEPWYTMEESEIFGIKSLYHDEIGWCYFIGGSGQVFGIIIAIGDAGLASYYQLRDPMGKELGLAEGLFRFWNQTIIHLEFTNPNELDKRDKLMHKVLEIPTAGNAQHCKFRYFQPGYPEKLPTDDQLPFIADCLEQARYIVTEYEKDEDFIYGPEEEFDEPKSLLRTSKEAGEDVSWENTYVELSHLENNLEVDREGLATTLETELFGLEMQHTKYYYFMRYHRGTVTKDRKGGPPFRPIFATLLAPITAYAHPPELLHYKSLRKTFARRFCRKLKELGFIPKTLIVNTTFAASLIAPIAEHLGMELQWNPLANEFMEFEKGTGDRF
jgi:hypothetical protein